MTDTNEDTSYPSAPVTFVDVPEVSEFAAEFIYNFFVADESVNDVGVEVDRNVDEVERKLERIAPRMVWFSFKPIILDTAGRGKMNEFRRHSDLDDVSKPSIEQANAAIRYEHELTSAAYTGLRFQDDNIDEKLFIVVSGAVERRIVDHNKGVMRQFDATVERIDRTLSAGNVNLFDAAKLMSTGKGTSDSRMIVNALNNLRGLNARFIDDTTQVDTLTKRFERVVDVGLDMQVRSKFINDVTDALRSDPFGVFTDEVLPVLAAASREQRRTRTSSDVTTMLQSEYDIHAEPVSTRRVNVTSFDTRRRVVGYIIDKHEVAADGSLTARKSIYVEDAAATTAFDVDIAYGRRYVYSIRTIVDIEVVAGVEGIGDVVAASLLVSSKRCRRRVVDTLDRTPPPPPVDVDVDWDRTASAARLTWSFPVNRQRDIKRWQVFRRQSIDAPFELIREYDFDDSVLRIQSGERPSSRLVERVKGPVNFHIDHGFDRTSHAVYAIAAVDAHGLMSNYSTQYEVRFDQASNRLIKRRVSVAGAPRPYPNMYVNDDDVLVDVLRDSGHDRVEVYFDPEFLDIVDARGSSTSLIATGDKGGMYRIQLVNVDLQLGDVLDIIVEDRRKSVKSKGKLSSVLKTGAKPFKRVTRRV